MLNILNIFISAILISAALWVSKCSQSIGGFIVSLPLSTLILLALSKIQNGEDVGSVRLAKSIFVAVPLTLLFFVPFLFSERLKLSFWSAYFMGLGLLFVSFGIHRWITLNLLAS